MTKKNRDKQTAAFKATLALAAIKRDATVAELAFIRTVRRAAAALSRWWR